VNIINKECVKKKMIYHIDQNFYKNLFNLNTYINLHLSHNMNDEKPKLINKIVTKVKHISQSYPKMVMWST